MHKLTPTYDSEPTPPLREFRHGRSSRGLRILPRRLAETLKKRQKEIGRTSSKTMEKVAFIGDSFYHEMETGRRGTT